MAINKNIKSAGPLDVFCIYDYRELSSTSWSWGIFYTGRRTCLENANFPHGFWYLFYWDLVYHKSYTSTSYQNSDPYFLSHKPTKPQGHALKLEKIKYYKYNYTTAGYLLNIHYLVLEKFVIHQYRGLLLEGATNIFLLHFTLWQARAFLVGHSFPHNLHE